MLQIFFKFPVIIKDFFPPISSKFQSVMKAFSLSIDLQLHVKFLNLMTCHVKVKQMILYVHVTTNCPSGSVKFFFFNLH